MMGHEGCAGDLPFMPSFQFISGLPWHEERPADGIDKDFRRVIANIREATEQYGWSEKDKFKALLDSCDSEVMSHNLQVQ